MKRIAFGVLLVAAFTSVRSAARPSSPCTRKDNVPFSQIAKELYNLTSGPCVGVLYCPTLTNTEIYPPQNNPKNYVGFWATDSTKPPVFDIAMQNKLVADAKAVAKEYQPKCSNGKPKTVFLYEFKPSVNGSQYEISVRLTYACCSQALPK